MDVLAVYFPSWHPDRHYEQWYGKGFSEWTLLRQTPPLFEGHAQPLECTWGEFDESDPVWMEKQIDLAADHGVTGFLFDWYWYKGEKFLEAAIEKGFMAARNRRRLNFCIMWANHTWGVWPATRDLYKGRPAETTTSEGQALAYDGTLLKISHSQVDMDAVVDECAQRYFGEHKYICVDGKPLFCLWYPFELERNFGSADAVNRVFLAMKERARRRGFPGLHISINIANIEPGLLCWRPEWIETYRKGGGVDSVFGYNIARTPAYERLTNERPVVPYDDVIESHRTLFRACENRGLPFCPVATIGCDNTPRWRRGTRLPVDFRKMGYEPIVTGGTPEKFGVVMREAMASARRQPAAPPFVLVNAWNEWTEYCYLLPERRTGLGYLQALQEAVAGTT